MSKLKQLREALGYNKNQFAEFLGIDNSYISTYESEKNPKNPGRKFVSRLKSKIPQLNEAFFFSENAPMFLEKVEKRQDINPESIKVFGKVKASLPVQMWEDQPYTLVLSHPKIDDYKGDKFAFVVDGDSMMDRWRHGDIVIGTEINKESGAKPSTRDFVVTYFDSDPGTVSANLKLLKWLDHDKKEFILEPLNTRHDVSRHYWKEVRRMFLIIGGITFVDYHKNKVRGHLHKIGNGTHK